MAHVAPFLSLQVSDRLTFLAPAIIKSNRSGRDVKRSEWIAFCTLHLGPRIRTLNDCASGYGEGCMGPLGELLATDHRQALEFFFVPLQDVSGPAVDRQELLYNASVLAHYAQTSTQGEVGLSAPANLSVLFDHFVSDP